MSEIKLNKPKKTDKKCWRCGHTLYTSDLPEYTYLCKYCDENFYSFEQ